MRVAAKLILTVVLLLIGLRTIDGYLTVQRELQMFRTDTHRDAVLLGDVLGLLISQRWSDEGQDIAEAVVAVANRPEHPVDIHWISKDRITFVTRDRAISTQEREQLLHGDDLFVEFDDAQGMARYFTYVPVDVGDQRVGYLELSETTIARDTYVNSTVRREILLALTVLLIGAAATAGMGLLIVGWPLQSLPQTIRRIGGGDLREPLRMNRRDEIGQLAAGLNALCDRLREAREALQRETDARVAAMDQLRHVDRLATIGRLASGVAHEMGTPLNVISGRAGMIRQDPSSSDQTKRYADIISKQADRMTAIVKNLLGFARPMRPQRRRIEVNARGAETISLLGSRVQPPDSIEFESGESLFVQADESQIQQVVTNIVVNAVEAAGERGTVRVAVRKVKAQPPGTDTAMKTYVAIEVQDDGPGIAEEHRARIFDPFFTTKDVGKGTGLGLSISWGIVTEHGGWIGVNSRSGDGACFTIYLPSENDACMEEC